MMLITIFLTYLKHNSLTDEVYAGRTAGKVEEITPDTILKVLKRRDGSHSKNKEGFDEAELDKFSTNADAIRGREQNLIDYERKRGKSANNINGISQRNKKRAIYLLAAVETFGEILMLIFHIQ